MRSTNRRFVASLAALLLAVGLLAGCVNPKPDDPASPENRKPDGTIETASVKPVVVLAPLETAITTTAAKWVKPGSTVDVTAAAPKNAKGAVTYLWALGALPGTIEVEKFNADTGSTGATYIKAGQSKSVKFAKSGTWMMHCHPHPWMKSNVTVIDGYTGPSLVEVKIVDGEKQGDYRFVPENIVIGMGTTVVYNNTGKQPHTATTEKQDPPLKKLALGAASGQVTLEGNGWQRLRVIALDGDGRYGTAFHDVYVAELPAAQSEKLTFEFKAGGLPAEVAGQAEPPQKKPFAMKRNGTLFVNFTAVDAVAGNGGPQNLAQVDIHVVASGATQDTLTAEAKDKGALTTHASAGPYDVIVVPKQGAGLKVEVIVEVVYDLDPPAPAMAAAGGDHGGHQH